MIMIDNSKKAVQETEKAEKSEKAERRLTVEIPTDVQAGRAAVCTCPPGCCGSSKIL
jgi:hypothetical protein